MFHGLASMFSKNEKTLSHCLMKAPSRDCINGYLGMKQPKQEAQSITSQAVRKKVVQIFIHRRTPPAVAPLASLHSTVVCSCKAHFTACTPCFCCWNCRVKMLSLNMCLLFKRYMMSRKILPCINFAIALSNTQDIFVDWLFQCFHQ